MHALSYYHHQIRSMTHLPLFRVRSWNNGIHCMFFYILIPMETNWPKQICWSDLQMKRIRKQNKANLRDLIAVTSLVILLKIGFKSSIFRSMWPSNLMDDLEKQYHTSSVLHQALCIISNPLMNSNCSYSPEKLNLGQNWRFPVLCDLEIWWMTLTNNRAPFLWYFKLCKSFQTICEFKLEKHSMWVEIDDFSSHVTLKFDRWPWNS